MELISNHKLFCGPNNQSFLDELPVLYTDVFCPKCDVKNLKLWPKDKVNRFHCKKETPETCELLVGDENEDDYDKEQRRKKGIKNQGYNMFLCYECDYAMCLACCKTSRRQPGASASVVPGPSQGPSGGASALPHPAIKNQTTGLRALAPSPYWVPPMVLLTPLDIP